MTAYVIDGKALARQTDSKTKLAAEQFLELTGMKPGLAVVRVGDDPASEVYVRTKVKRARALGVHSEDSILPSTATQQQVAEVIAQLAARKDIHGILLQLPLPAHLDSLPLIEAIPPVGDVDGFHSVNVAALAQGRKSLVACTPTGCVKLAKLGLSALNNGGESNMDLQGVSLSGAHAVVVGRSQIVGRPLSQLLLQADCTVTVAHSRTRDLAATCRDADLLFLAVGRPEFASGEWVKPGAVVVDVGINRVTDPTTGEYRLVGDAHAPSVMDVAGALTPVPGGVGPMTISCLMANAVSAAATVHGISAEIDELQN